MTAINMRLITDFSENNETLDIFCRKCKKLVISYVVRKELENAAVELDVLRDRLRNRYRAWVFDKALRQGKADEIHP